MSARRSTSKNCSASADDTGNIERSRNNSGVRGRPTGGRAKAENPLGIELRGVRGCQVIGDKNDSMIGQSWRTMLSSSEQTQDALADIVEVRSSLGEPLVLNLLQLHRTTFNGMLPRPSRTVAGFDMRGDLLEDFRVVQERQVRSENRGLTFARLF